jgi:hypothetical protein
MLMNFCYYLFARNFCWECFLRFLDEFEKFMVRKDN